MINFCSKKTLFFISFFSVFFVFLSITSVNAACSWKLLGDSGCLFGETSSADKNCTGVQPAPVTINHKSTYYGCCCSNEKSVENVKKAEVQTVELIAKMKTDEAASLFTIPDFQVKIPGLDKLATITCITGQECNIPWIGQYIAGIYNYALAIVGILAAIILMAGGLMWIISAGDASKITQAKELIIGSISGLLILIASYALLVTINPDLVNLGGVAITSIARQDVTPTPSDPASFAAKCKPVTTGNCAVANMSGFGARANEASGICMAESSGNANIYNSLTRCTGGEYAVWGLFQFNLSANTFIDKNGKTLNCPSAFNKPWVNSKPTCTVVNKDLYNACVATARDPQLSILNAQKLVTARNWGPWEANSKFCKF